MFLRPRSFVLWLPIALLLGGCGRQGQGESCSTQGNDCSSGLTCQPIAGYMYLGKCCPPNSQCGSTQTASILHQDDDAGVDDGGLDANVQSIDAERGTGATDAGATDAGAFDTGATDTGVTDTGAMDTGATDAGSESGTDASDGGEGG